MKFKWWWFVALEIAWFVVGFVILSEENANSSLLCFIMAEVFATRRQLLEKSNGQSSVSS